MQIVHYNTVNFTIDQDGQWGLSSTWHIVDDGQDRITQWETLYTRVLAWAGSPGDDFRFPNADSQGYTPNSSYEITDIQLNALSRFEYEVAYSGTKRFTGSPEQILGISTQTNNNNETVKTGKWRVDDTDLSGFLPAIGDVLAWAGGAFLCDDIKIEPETANSYIVTIVARDMAVLMLGNPSTTTDGFLQKIKTATWRVDTATLDSWLPAIGDATGTWDGTTYTDVGAWGDPDYYITDIKQEAIGKLGYQVTLTARHISIRHISTAQKHNYKSKDSDGGNKVNKVWTVKWQCTAVGINAFENLAGTEAEVWTNEPNTIVTDVDIRPMNTVEYEVSITVNKKDNPDANEGDDDDDKSNLGQKITINTGKTQYTLSAEQCGRRIKGATDWPYEINDPPRNKDGKQICAIFKVLKDGSTTEFQDEPIPIYEYPKELDETTDNLDFTEWNGDGAIISGLWHGEDCPFATTTTLKDGLHQALPASYVGRTWDLETVTITLYYPKNIASIAVLIDTGDKVGNQFSVDELCGRRDVGNPKANFVRINQSARGVLDNEGAQWTEITSTYMKSPNNTIYWSDNYKGFE